MYFVCKIDRGIYSVVTPNIRTDEVIITEERIQHIRERHPNDFERFSGYFRLILESPDYIVEANRRNTVLVLKEIKKDGELFKLILRLCTSEDAEEIKNSIITFMKIDNREWRRLVRNKKILYKRED